MKKIILGFMLMLFATTPTQAIQSDELTVLSRGISQNLFLDKYGKRGKTDQKGMPVLSIPIEIKRAPKGTKTFALLLEDPDAIPVAGFSWTHWLVANLKKSVLKEGASRSANTDFIEGTNSWGAVGYGGMAPPNAPHTYLLRVYALKTELPLKPGFSLAEFNDALAKAQEAGNILGRYTLAGVYQN